MIRKWIPVYTAAIILLASLGSAHAARTENAAAITTSSADELKQQVDRWVDELSKQPSFDSWKDASADISALGPGTHGWYVKIINGGQAIGYMIVHALPEGGFMLGEYGHGAEPMFAARPLYRSLVQLELIPSSYFKLSPEHQKQDPMFTAERLYLQPLHSVWKITLLKQNDAVHYFDGKTGEYLPIDDMLWAAVQRHYDQSNLQHEAKAELTSMITERINPRFDPYERFPWLTKPPLQGDLQEELQRRLDRQQKIWFSSEPYDDSMRYVWPVIGYHMWDNNQLFIIIDQEGNRFIPLASLSGYGHFYN